MMNSKIPTELKQKFINKILYQNYSIIDVD